MPSLLGAVFLFVFAALYVASPFLALIAWHRTRRIVDLERRLREAEKRLQTLRTAGSTAEAEHAGREVALESSREGRGPQSSAWPAFPTPTGGTSTVAPVGGSITTAPPTRRPSFDDFSFNGVRNAPPTRLPEPVSESESQPDTAVPPVERPATRRSSRGWRAWSDTWDEGLGGSVLAKLGAVLVVIGVALFVGWSMMHLGPAGRVATALSLSGLLLATGLVTQRWADYRNVSLGLSAAGWGGLYVTAYAMHGLEAARMIRDPLTAFGLLLAVAAGMIVHALWLGMPTLVTAAYAAAFAAVALGPPTSYAIVACVVLAATLLAVAYRYDWMNLAVAGLVCTYGLLALRSPSTETGPGLAGFMIAHAMIWVCWFLFEGFDILLAFRGRGRTGTGQVVMPLNLCGLLGVTLLLLRNDAVDYAPFLAATAVAYAASTLCRAAAARMSRGSIDIEPISAGTPLGYEASVTIAVVLCAAALATRFQDGWRLHVGLLLEAEFLFLVGVVLGQRCLRILAAWLFVVALVRFVIFDVLPGGELAFRGLTLLSWTPSALLAAAVLAINRGYLHRTGRRTLLVAEQASTYATTALVAAVIGGEAWHGHNGLTPAMIGVAWLLFAWLLLEIAIRWRLLDAYRQSCLLNFATVMPLAGINAFPLFYVAGTDGRPPAWVWLLPAVAILYAMVWRVARQPWLATVDPSAAIVTGPSLAAASGLALVLLWHALPAPLVALGWAAFAVLAFQIGLWLPHASLRWHAYLAVAMAVARLFLANFTNTGMTAFVSHRLLTVVPVILLLYNLAARLADRRLRPLVGPGERTVGALCCWAGTAVLVVLLRFELGRVLAVVGWAVLGLVLLANGRRGAAHLRWQSHAIAMLTFARSWGTHFVVPGVTGDLLQPWVLGGLVVASLFASELLCPPDGRRRRPPAGIARLLAWLDAHRRSYYAILGTTLLAVLLVHETPASLLTAALGIEGAGLLVLGFVRPDRSLRMCGLAVLAICIPKLFFWDLRHLETPYRILSFLLLGILLIAASWFYARFKQRLRSMA